MPYLPHTDADLAAMLDAVGVASLDDLFAQVPEAHRVEGDLDLPRALTEWELLDHMDQLAADTATIPRNRSFLGAGCHDHFRPTVVDHLLSRGEFATAYTPYQPEVSQGTLQAIYEYQTLVTRLTGLEVANASLYDGATALAEAVLMALRVTRRRRVVVSRAVHPHHRAVLSTYLAPTGFEIEELPFGADGRCVLDALAPGDDLAAVVVQSPNFFGCIEDLAAATRVAHGSGALSVASCTEALAFGLLRSPGAGGADIAVGEGQSLGVAPSFGGPGVGLFATRLKLVRQMPGRIVGRTLDRDGRPGFVLTLATREQHIRRERATSNVCTNQSLCALTASVYLATLGKTGFRALARLNRDKAEYLKRALAEAGAESVFDAPTFNEFTVRWSEGAEAGLAAAGFVPGVPLGPHYPELEGCSVVCATETKTRADLDALVAGMGR